MGGFVEPPISASANPSRMRLRLLFHDHCFDGVASAAVFTRFYLARVRPDAEVSYAGLLHRPGSLFDDGMFDGDENAIVDFKYSPSDRLTWWFDHHQSAFLTPADEAHFRADRSGQKFWDADSKSCTEFIARVARDDFGFEDERLSPLVKWAHTIDGAFYESPAQVVELREPALQLMQVIENVDDPAFIERLIRSLTETPLDEVALSPEVRSRLAPIRERHLETLEAVRRKITYARGAVNFDLIEEGFEGFNKFIPYYLHPETTYSVALTRTAYRTKISVGSNPWSPRPRTHNIASICERYGGGGHAVVGAVSFAPEEVERARQAAKEIVAELQGDFRE
ncbi:MAG: phosphoesterase [Pyrinomonadaceae bacterium]